MRGLADIVCIRKRGYNVRYDFGYHVHGIWGWIRGI